MMNFVRGVRATTATGTNAIIPLRNLQILRNNLSFLTTSCDGGDGYHNRFEIGTLRCPVRHYSSRNKDDKHGSRNVNHIVTSINAPWSLTSTHSYSSIQASSISTKDNSSNTFNLSKHLDGSTRTLAISGYEPTPSNGEFVNGKPTLAYARTIPKTFANLSNEMVLHFMMLGVREACRECVVRDIMSVDNVEYDEAMKVFENIAKDNREFRYVYGFPFKLGFGVAFTGAFASFPLVFHEGAMKWFNETFVTADLPPAEDLETWLEVGAASWGWMEPVLGQVSFFLLCMQFARSQLQNLGIRPYFNWQRDLRAKRLVGKYPRYDPEFLEAYSKSDPLINSDRLAH